MYPVTLIGRMKARSQKVWLTWIVGFCRGHSSPGRSTRINSLELGLSLAVSGRLTANGVIRAQRMRYVTQMFKSRLLSGGCAVKPLAPFGRWGNEGGGAAITMYISTPALHPLSVLPTLQLFSPCRPLQKSLLQTFPLSLLIQPLLIQAL